MKKVKNREKLAKRLASYLWYLSNSVGSTTGNKEDIISATTEQFLEDKNWPYPNTTVPPKEFKDE